MTGRCLACNKKLSDQEMNSKIKSNLTQKTEYAELCFTCLQESDINHFVVIKGKPVPLLEVEDE